MSCLQLKILRVKILQNHKFSSKVFMDYSVVLQNKISRLWLFKNTQITLSLYDTIFVLKKKFCLLVIDVEMHKRFF